MSILIAKKYVKALLIGNDSKKLAAVNDQLKIIASAYKNEKFKNIISSIEITSDKKVELIHSFIDNIDENLLNLIKLLAQNKRLNIINDISLELNKEVSILTNNYTGVIYSNESLSDEYISNIQNNFAKKFNIELELINDVCDYDGIKVDIDGLGVEISFAKNMFRSQMINHILKAV